MSKLQVSTEVPNEIHMTRVFDAPRRLVIKAMTTPELMKRWMGGQRGELTSADVDFRVGGRYRHAYRAHDGFVFAFVGEFREIADDRIVQTQAMEGMPGEAVITATFTEVAGKTTMKLVMRFASQAERDQVVKTGMAEGAGESYDVLEQLLASL